MSEPFGKPEEGLFRDKTHLIVVQTTHLPVARFVVSAAVIALIPSENIVGLLIVHATNAAALCLHQLNLHVQQHMSSWHMAMHAFSVQIFE